MTLHIHIHRAVTQDAEPRKPRAAGVACFSPEGRVLLLLRSEASKNGGMWGLPAGGIEKDETPWEAARRECFEETGHKLDFGLKHVWTDGGFVLFAKRCEMFAPVLNHEHSAYAWAFPSSLPTPLHPLLRLQIQAARLRA